MPEDIIIDGYNLIYASEELGALARRDIDAARDMLISRLETYSVRRDRRIEVVFDAAGREGPSNSERRSESLLVTFTAEGESADTYIERLAYSIADDPRPALLVTGDYNQQKVAMGAGLLRMSSREFLIEMEEALSEEDAGTDRHHQSVWKVEVAERLPEDVRTALDRLKHNNS